MMSMVSFSPTKVTANVTVTSGSANRNELVIAASPCFKT